MSRDSSRSYIHLHSPRLADLMEDFTQPATSSNSSNSQAQQQPPQQPSSSTHIPHEDIFVPSHLMPPNPEDEDEVVPNQHAAFGISRVMAAREGKERQWRDFESLAGLVRGVDAHDKSVRGKAGVVGDGNATGSGGLR